MVNWLEVQAIGTVALVATSAGAIAYAALQLRHERDYRSVANLEKQLDFFQSPVFVAARRKLAVDRMDGDMLRQWHIDEPPVSVFEVLDFYEHLGLLVKKGHVQIYDVWHTFYEWAQPVYSDLKPMIEDEDSPYTDHYLDLRRLMAGMDTIQRQHMKTQKGDHWRLWTPERILAHYKYEIEIGGRPRRTRR
jgi:hypothetical protein